MALDRKKGIIIVAATVAGVFILITIIVIAVATTGKFFNANYVNTGYEVYKGKIQN